jgi:RIO kinase 1
MTSRESKRKRPEREEKILKERHKIESEVFDPPALHVLNDMIRKDIVKSVDYPIEKGKEANVFRATTSDGFAAVKIYRIETSNFIHMTDYLLGDPRFAKVKSDKKSIVKAWVAKEYRNLLICHEAGVRVPEPLAYKNNVLVMELIGEKGMPDSTLQRMGSDAPEAHCDELLEMIEKLWRRGFVHGDLSEFNILMHGHSPSVPYVIDVGQGVLEGHPKAREFLKRDVENILRYFSKYGVKREGVLERIMAAAEKE